MTGQLNLKQEEEEQKQNLRIEKGEKKIYLKEDIILNINNELNQYYLFTKEQIKSIFYGYIYYIEKNEKMYKRKRFGSENYLINPEESKDMICYEIDELKFWNK